MASLERRCLKLRCLDTSLQKQPSDILQTPTQPHHVANLPTVKDKIQLNHRYPYYSLLHQQMQKVLNSLRNLESEAAADASQSYAKLDLTSGLF